MKAVILDGSENGDKAWDSIRQVIADELTSMDWGVQSLILRDLEIHYCLGCSGCWLETPGICVIEDAGRDVAREVIQSDLAVFLTRLTFGGYSPELKKALDRFCCPLLSPLFIKTRGKVRHKPRYERYPRLMAVGLLPRADEESERIFTTLVSRNALNLHAPAHAGGVVLSSQGLDEIRAKIQTLLKAVEVKQ